LANPFSEARKLADEAPFRLSLFLKKAYWPLHHRAIDGESQLIDRIITLIKFVFAGNPKIRFAQYDPLF